MSRRRSDPGTCSSESRQLTDSRVQISTIASPGRAHHGTRLLGLVIASFEPDGITDNIKLVVKSIFWREVFCGQRHGCRSASERHLTVAARGFRGYRCCHLPKYASLFGFPFNGFEALTFRTKGTLLLGIEFASDPKSPKSGSLSESDESSEEWRQSCFRALHLGASVRLKACHETCLGPVHRLAAEYG